MIFCGINPERFLVNDKSGAIGYTNSRVTIERQGRLFKTRIILEG
jgi:hypothetical protein